MKRRTLLAVPAALAVPVALAAGRARAADKVKIVWWHAMTAALADEVARIAAGFNASQDAVEIQAVYKGGYADTLTAVIAASRAGQAPHLVQVFEVGHRHHAGGRQGGEAGVGTGPRKRAGD